MAARRSSSFRDLPSSSAGDAEGEANRSNNTAAATVTGFALVPVFASFGSIYRAHGAFTAAIS